MSIGKKLWDERQKIVAMPKTTDEEKAAMIEKGKALNAFALLIGYEPNTSKGIYDLTESANVEEKIEEIRDWWANERTMATVDVLIAKSELLSIYKSDLRESILAAKTEKKSATTAQNNARVSSEFSARFPSDSSTAQMSGTDARLKGKKKEAEFSDRVDLADLECERIELVFWDAKELLDMMKQRIDHLKGSRFDASKVSAAQGRHSD